VLYWYRLSDVDVNGLITTYPAISAMPNAAAIKIEPITAQNNPDDYDLQQNYPNPFNPATRIRFTLPQEDYIILSVHSITGKSICKMFEGHLSAGYYELQWPGTDQSGNAVAAGVYFYTISSDNYFRSRKMILLR
jgi:hypothetical protein